MESATAMPDDEVPPSPADAPQELTWTIVLENMGLVYKISNELCRHNQDRKDLVQEGLVGLFEAARRFDPSRDTAFSTYAYHYIRGAILAYFQDRPQEDVARDFKPLGDVIGEPVLDEDRLQRGDGAGTNKSKADVWLDSCEIDFIRTDLARHLRAHLESDLDEMERLIVAVRWLGDEQVTLEIVAKTLGVSRQNVQQIEQQAFAKLRLGLAKGK